FRQRRKKGKEGLIMAKQPTVRNEAGPAGPGADGADNANLPDETDLPGKPTELTRGSWLAAGRRTLRAFKPAFLPARAPPLTSHGVLSIFPGILVLVSLLGLVGQSATQPLIKTLTNAAPSTVRTILRPAIHNLQQGHGSASVLAIVGILIALWSTSGYVAAF